MSVANIHPLQSVGDKPPNSYPSTHPNPGGGAVIDPTSYHAGTKRSRSGSPVSRLATPSASYPSNIAPQHLFDASTHTSNAVTHPFDPSASGVHLRAPSPSSSSSAAANGNLDTPQTYDALLTANNVLKTRVNELEVINDLFRGTVTQLESSENTLRQEIQSLKNGEKGLKRRIEELEAMVEDAGGDSKRKRLHEEHSHHDGGVEGLEVDGDAGSEYPDPEKVFAT